MRKTRVLMPTLVLGIETTAHTFGIGIVDDKGAVLANERESFTTSHEGMIPWKVAEHHFDRWKSVLDAALARARVTLRDVGLVAFSQGPGMGHCLRVGSFLARCIALKYGTPILGVNHCIAHLSIGQLRTAARDPVLLYTSGANTQVIAFEGRKYRVVGETLDMGVGNFLDSVARELGLGFPGGPKLEQLARKGRKLIELPYTVKGMDVSFGGLFTNLRQTIRAKRHRAENLVFSLQETVFAMLVEIAERAMAHTGKDELLLGGGVACNARLQEMCRIMCKERGAAFFVPENEFLVDNGAMIAWQGLLEHRAGRKQRLRDTGILPHWRTDQVAAAWR